MDSLYERYAAQLVRMAQHPGARDYARERAQELERDQYGLFQGIYQDVKERLKAGQAKPTGSDSLSPEKPR
jgi:hypothetical protein